MINIIGKYCKSIIVSDFWLNGELVTELVALYLILDDNEKYKIYLDDEDNKWEIINTHEHPSSNDILGDDTFKYSYKDIGEKYNLINKLVTGFKELDIGDAAEATLSFNDNSALKLIHYYRNDKSVIEYQAPNKT